MTRASTLAACIFVCVATVASVAHAADDAIATTPLELRADIVSELRAENGFTRIVLRGSPIAAYIMIANREAEAQEAARKQAIDAERLAAAREGRAPGYSSLAHTAPAVASVQLPRAGAGWYAFAQVSILKRELDSQGAEIWLPWIDSNDIQLEVQRARDAGLFPVTASAGALGSSSPITISPSQSERMPVGLYVLRCSFDSTTCTEEGAWRGVIPPTETVFAVQDPQPKQAATLALDRARYYANYKLNSEALSELTVVVLHGDRAQVSEGLLIQSRVKRRAGDLTGALAAMQTYSQEFGQNLSAEARRKHLEELKFLESLAAEQNNNNTTDDDG